ncbi:MAG: fluoride efflux transporter CrcB [Neisseriaceae bacterium]|nr:fluoride efflux transporter CrcB [Neisseriaceae bacterium]
MLQQLWLWVALGAAGGGLGRYGFGLLVGKGAWFQWPTLVVNVLGGFVIGAVAFVLLQKPEASPVWRVLLITGFCGGFTTFSSFSLEMLGLLQAQRYAGAISLALAHVLLSVAATALAWWLLQKWWA